MFNFLSQSLLGFIFWLNKFFSDPGLSIIVFTFILKVILSPLEFLSFLEERKINRLKPQISEIVKKYRNDFVKQAEELTELYKKEKYNPFLSMLFQFLPLPIFISIFITFNQLLKIEDKNLTFLGLIDLTKTNLFLALAVIIFQSLFILNLDREQRKFAFLFFGLIVIVLMQFPAIFNLYWLVNLTLSFIQRPIFKFLDKINNQKIIKLE